jgi:crossover junction endodeoxyribonuclease RuvC
VEGLNTNLVLSRNATENIVLAIDPGLNGALAFLDSEKSIKIIEDMPLTTEKLCDGRTKKNVSGSGLAHAISPFAHSIRIAVIEDVSAMTYVDSSGKVRGQGAAASFAFGKGFGVVIGVLEALQVPIVFVKPAIWKLKMGLSSNKQGSLDLATKLFPLQKHLWPLKKHDGRAEAVLLAVFGYRSFRGFLK